MTTSSKEEMSVTRHITVTKNRTIDFLADDGADAISDAGRVYATPAMVGDIETVCRDFMLEQLDEGMDSLGTRVDVAHMTPTLMDMWAEITATLSKVEGRAMSGRQGS